MREAKGTGGTIGTEKKNKKKSYQYEPVPEKYIEICSNTASHQYDQYATTSNMCAFSVGIVDSYLI